MSHRVEDYIDAERISDFFRKIVEIIVALALALPAIAIIGIVTRDYHYSAFVIEDRAVVNLLCVPPFPRSAAIVLTLHTETDVGNLALRLDIEDAMVDRMVER